MITVEWLRMKGFKQHSQESTGWMSIPIERRGRRILKRLVIRPRGKTRAIVEIHDDSMLEPTQIVRLPYAETCGQVLLLCRALGIKVS